MTPQTDAEAHRVLAERIVGPSQLVQAYAGQMDLARQAITSVGFCGGGASAQVEGRVVRYRFTDGPSGTVKVADLLRLAARAAPRGAVRRLTDALEMWGAVHREEHERWGVDTWARPEVVREDPRRADWCRRRDEAQREIYAAQAAWWETPADEEPVGQLDLFATTEGPQ